MNVFALAHPHDLLELDGAAPYFDTQPPPWAEQALERAPWVTVRRAIGAPDAIPTGVRGVERNQRWAASVSIRKIKRIMHPWDILDACRKNDLPREKTIPAMRALHALMTSWDTAGYAWGPAGSIGFELATGVASATPESDLDLVLHGEKPMSYSTALTLSAAFEGCGVRVDALVETAECGFSLLEYARENGGPILLRTARGPRLGRDPWSVLP